MKRRRTSDDHSKTVQSGESSDDRKTTVRRRSRSRDLKVNRRDPSNDDDADAQIEGSPQSSSKPRRLERDPDGTLGIARGVNLTKEDAEQAELLRQELLKKSQSEAVQAHLWGPLGEVNKKRLEVLKRDDERPNTAALNSKQKHALDKRQRRRETNKVLTATLQRHETKRLEAAVAAADAEEILQTDQAGSIQPENDMERTTALKQVELKRKYLDAETARHIYDLDLSSTGPYGMEYDRSGRYAILYGQTGHVALMDCSQPMLMTEFFLHERVRDACFLHNFTLAAVAQKSHVFIYDQHGAEVHRLGDHADPMALQFLPYHWLLASVGRAGWLKYQDTSTGQLVSQHRTQLGPCSVLRQNPSNAVLHAGHANGTVTLWSPASSRYLVKMLCHKGAEVLSLAIDPTGHYMVTGGADRQVKVWDLRTFQPLHAYYTAAGTPTSLDISQRGVLGIGHAGHATFWSSESVRSKVKDPYMHHAMPRCGPVETLRFRPYEDVCGIGHARGVSSIVIPGAGEPSVDLGEHNTNPFQDTKQRREAEVRALLDKLSPDMIGLDPDQVGGIEASDPHSRLERLQDMQDEANAKLAKQPPRKEKNKKRGRSKIQSKLRRKHKNIIDQSKIKLMEAREKEKATAVSTGDQPKPESLKEAAPAALKRFFK